jgi:hypothetical protein
MAEATESLRLIQLRTTLHFATMTLALQAAMKITKRRLQAQGLKVSHLPMRELRARAEAYLAEHRDELIADAKQIVEQWRRNGFFGKRAQCAALTTDTQRRKG